MEYKPELLYRDSESQTSNDNSTRYGGSHMEKLSTVATRVDDEGGEGVEEEEEEIQIDDRKLTRKIDFRIIPMLALLYLLSFLDRGNIGNARIEGLADDLNLQGNEYNLCLTVYFLTYAFCEVPTNILFKYFNRPSIFLPTIMVLWGVNTMCLGFVQDYHGLLVARLTLGIAEAGLYPGVVFYLTKWYTTSDIQLRQTFFFALLSMAGLFSGLLAYAISKMDGAGGYEGWRWIFILEGIATVVIAALAYFILYDYPDTLSFLTPLEREYLLNKLKYDTNSKSDDQTAKKLMKSEESQHRSMYIKQLFKDWQIYLQLLCYYGVCVPLYAISLFLPTIINNLGYTSTDAQLLTIPVYITACIASITVAYFSDRTGLRSPFILGGYCLMLIGFIMAVSANPVTKPGVVYAGVYIVALGIYPTFPGVVTWCSNNLSGDYKRAVGSLFQIGLGNLSGLYSSNFYRSTDGPRFIMGHCLCIGFVAMGIISLFCLVYGYDRSNKQKQRNLQNGVYNSLSDLELIEMGDKSPYFKYRL